MMAGARWPGLSPMGPVVSVVIPSRNRPRTLAVTLAALAAQEGAPAYEVLVVDDGSSPPVTEAIGAHRILRLPGLGRSAARNAGAGAAIGEILVFVDDDIVVRPDFLGRHLHGHRRWPGALAVGRTVLPTTTQGNAFGRFRERLERRGVPTIEGPTALRNLCTASNMSIARARFEELGGFDSALSEAEDQDLALRHTAEGGTIVYLRDAEGVHDDSAVDLGSYCRRVEAGAREIVRFCRKHPDWPDNRHRHIVNGPTRWGREPLSRSVRKAVKASLGVAPLFAVLLRTISTVERLAPRAAWLDPLYRAMIGVCIQRGFRSGAEPAE